MPPPTLTS